jgi:hypothetical protein
MAYINEQLLKLRKWEEDTKIYEIWLESLERECGMPFVFFYAGFKASKQIAKPYNCKA